MTLKECSALLAPAALALGVQLDQPMLRAYYRALEDVPVELLRQACELAARAQREPYAPRFPTAPTLRAWAEEARRRWMAAHKWQPCEACELSPGFVEQIDDAGVVRMARCMCWRAHAATIAASGMAEPVALPPAPERPREELDA